MTRFSYLIALVGVALLGGVAFVPQHVEADDDTNEANEIRFVLTGLNASAGGTVRCALYRDEETWLDTSRRFMQAAANVRRSSAACVFRDVPPGTYAIAALHDENGDREMERSLLGIPREGYAISRNERNRMSRPDFDEAAIQFEGGQMVTRALMNY